MKICFNENCVENTLFSSNLEDHLLTEFKGFKRRLTIMHVLRSLYRKKYMHFHSLMHSAGSSSRKSNNPIVPVSTFPKVSKLLPGRFSLQFLTGPEKKVSINFKTKFLARALWTEHPASRAQYFWRRKNRRPERCRKSEIQEERG